MKQTASIFLALILWQPAVFAQKPDQRVLDAVEQFVRPLLIDQCVSCHGPKKQESGVRLDSRTGLFADYEFGKLVVAGAPAKSRLIQVLQHADDDIGMPPKARLSDQQIRILTEWVRLGAPWPDEPDPAATAATQEERRKSHWAFQPVVRHSPPAVRATSWTQGPIDAFVLARLEAAGLQPAPPADPRTLVRRVYFDLIGLPPPFEVIRKFTDNPEPAAFEQIVDDLLASERFGERWARHWMDVARYSDTTGYLFQQERKLGDAWTYRDWLIHSINRDMPVDEFLIRQIAVDKLDPEAAESELAATGFLTLGRRFLNNTHDIIDDRIDVVTRGMMGLTVTCARCHDHKYDPIPARDYYSLYGVFASTHEPDRKKTTVRLADLPKPFDPYVFLRGKPQNRGERVPRRFLSVLAPDAAPFSDGSGRLELARAIASADNPLTARVFVNRVWGHLLGRHLVATPSDFGVRSDPPTHPKLLDHLAASLMDDGWSMKGLVRRIVLSATYRQSSIAAPAANDPDNKLLSRMNRKRLELEPHRDALLAVSGDLDAQVGGESVDITKPPFPNRRTVYAQIDRQNLPGMFRSFDLASPDTHAPQRYQTTVPQQALFQLNNPFVLERADALAARVQDVSTDPEKLQALFRLALGRDPQPAEADACLAFLDRPEPAAATTSANGWQYGYGYFDAAANRVTEFTPYPAFHDGNWRGGPALPDPKLGWSFLSRRGGHPGVAHLAAIRRWIAPADGRLTVRGVLHHPAEPGDGVIGRIVVAGTGQLSQWDVHRRSTPTVVPGVNVRRGESVDFVVESGPTISHDSFDWRVSLQLKSGSEDVRANSDKDFAGPADPVDVWTQLAQVLLLSNEFVFVD